MNGSISEWVLMESLQSFIAGSSGLVCRYLKGSAGAACEGGAVLREPCRSYCYVNRGRTITVWSPSVAAVMYTNVVLRCDDGRRALCHRCSSHFHFLPCL